MTEKKKDRVGVFIDGSNLFWAMNYRDPRTGGLRHYHIDFRKLRTLLKKRYGDIDLFYYGCEDEQPRSDHYKKKAHKQKAFHAALERKGYILRKKALKHIGAITKCDMDVEIVMDVTQSIEGYDIVVLFSGDSDFLALLEWCYEYNKKVHVYAFKRFLSWELWQFAQKQKQCAYWLLDSLQSELERL